MRRLLLLAVLAATQLFAAEDGAPLKDGLYAEFDTTRGTFVCELFYKQTPLTVSSFVGLAEGTLGPAPGKPFFNGLTFHRVVPGFVIQGGDPLGNGSGGPGYEFADEFVPGLRHDAAGILSMANAGPDTNGSQFFVTLAPVNRLNYLHSVFGRIVSGADIPEKVEQGDTFSVKIIRIGADATSFHVTPESFAALEARIPAYPYPYFDDPEGLLPTDWQRAKAFNQKLTSFARFTGIKVYVRLFSEPDPLDGDAKPGAIAKRFAEKYGVRGDGVSVIHFSSNDTWAIWVGGELAARFTPAGTTIDTKFHNRKSEFFKQALAKAADNIAAINAKREADKQLEANQVLKLQVDAVIDDLLFLLEPRS